MFASVAILVAAVARATTTSLILAACDVSTPMATSSSSISIVRPLLR
ncbi:MULTISPECIES: hypothetical protein [Proteus]|nr:hypothetical protein [Proteus mirabilis]